MAATAAEAWNASLQHGYCPKETVLLPLKLAHQWPLRDAVFTPETSTSMTADGYRFYP